MLRQLPPITDPNVLVGTNTVDDAAIYRLSDDLALVQTVDFFPPIVDDPYDYGAIAAANAVSDVYAMGGRPLTALNIVCFPDFLPRETLVQILQGAADKAAEAGFTIVGGHTIKDAEPKFGLAVTGIIDPRKVVTNAGAKPGDVLILTKPLGTGVITTALKEGQAPPEAVEQATAVMKALNKAAAEVMVQEGVNACTDITGYGLMGHLLQMTTASGVGAEVVYGRVPVLSAAWSLAAGGFISGGTRANCLFVAHKVTWADGVSEEARLVLCDAQTSGGLLMTVPQEKGQRVLEALHEVGVGEARIIGRVTEEREGRIVVHP